MRKMLSHQRKSYFKMQSVCMISCLTKCKDIKKSLHFSLVITNKPKINQLSGRTCYFSSTFLYFEKSKLYDTQKIFFERVLKTE